MNHPDLLVGTETSDDAGVFRLRPDLALVNTVDFFPPNVDDPYTFGQIAGANSLSDVYAMGGEPRTAMNIVCFPQKLVEMGILADILRGGADKVAEAGAVLVGGHTVVDDEIKYGLAVTGVIHPDRIVKNVGAQEGDVLILTKPLGTGIVTTAIKKKQAPKKSVEAAIQSMRKLNKTASELMVKVGVHACSDITGFGLMGHAFGMAIGSGVTFLIESSQLPLLPAVEHLADRGYVTGGGDRNRAYLRGKLSVDRKVSSSLEKVSLDPQTSGGLLISVAERKASRLLRQLHGAGIESATVIGKAIRRRKDWVKLV
jgi:selenide,water dikinase